MPELPAGLISAPSYAGDNLAVRGWALPNSAAWMKRRRFGGASLTHVMRGYGLLGGPDEAFRLPRTASNNRLYPLLQIDMTPASDPLRADPRFRQLLTDFGLLRYRQ